MKTLLLCFSFFLLGPQTHAEPQLAGNQRYKKELNESVDDYMSRRYSVELNLDSPQMPGRGYGVSAGIGYLHEMMGFDIRARFGSMQTGEFFTPPTEMESTTIINQSPQSQIYQPRDDHSSWTYFMIEPGVSVTGKLLPLYLKKWSETARFGIAKSSFTDSASSLAYHGWVISTEAIAAYHFSYTSPYSFHFGMGLNWGWITRDSTPAGLQSEGDLPVRFMRYIAGVAYAF